MKTTTTNLAGIALLCATLFTGCSLSDSDHVTNNDNAIRLSAGLRAAVNRTVVEDGVSFVAGIGGWETQTSVDYTQQAKWETTATIVASSSASGSNVKFDKGQFYNSPNTTYMKAWYPIGTLADGKVTFVAGNGSGYNADGTVDVMLAPQVSGSVTDKGTKNLAFEHKLTQIKFKVVADESYVGKKLKSITIKEAQVPTGIDLTTDQVTYAAPAPLPVPNISMQMLTESETSVGSCAMIAPFAGNTFVIEAITLTGDVADQAKNATITLDGDLTFVPGRAYTILLAFGKPGIGGVATVTPWTTGTGTGSVE